MVDFTVNGYVRSALRHHGGSNTMYCLNCGEEIEEDYDEDDEEDPEDSEDESDEEFCSEECREEYNAKFLLVAMIS